MSFRFLGLGSNSPRPFVSGRWILLTTTSLKIEHGNPVLLLRLPTWEIKQNWGLDGWNTTYLCKVLVVKLSMNLEKEKTGRG